MRLAISFLKINDAKLKSYKQKISSENFNYIFMFFKITI